MALQNRYHGKYNIYKSIRLPSLYKNKLECLISNCLISWLFVTSQQLSNYFIILTTIISIFVSRHKNYVTKISRHLISLSFRRTSSGLFYNFIYILDSLLRKNHNMKSCICNMMHTVIYEENFLFKYFFDEKRIIVYAKNSRCKKTISAFTQENSKRNIE